LGITKDSKSPPGMEKGEDRERQRGSCCFDIFTNGNKGVLGCFGDVS